MATRSSSCPSPSPPNADPLPSSAAAKKPQPVPWTHEETVNLIRAYEEKWYALKRGPLKSSQWEEVAVTVAARCGYSYAEPSKTATQCRHKMEKLRKRYRAEKQRAGAVSGWPYYEMMERLERGPMPISVRPIAVVPHGARRAVEEGDDEEEEEEEADEEDNEDEDYDGNYSKSRSINHILRRPAMVKRFPRASAAAGGVKRKRAAEKKIEEEEDEEDEEGEGGERRSSRRRRAVWEIAGEIRGFAERYVGMENVKMEMMRESERWRMELERKRMDLIAESQGKIIDTIAKAFCFPSS